MSTRATDRTIGFVVNPIAGMGGPVGLKGTDDRLEEAIDRGATPRAPARAERAMTELARIAPSARILAADDPMGASIARDAGFDPTVVYTPGEQRTDASDTKAAVDACCERSVDLLLFVGGDGTAADVATALGGLDVPMLGIPSGVKMFSSVFAATPEDAARLAATFDDVEERDVMDIDEDAYRGGSVRATLLHVVPVPIGPALQAGKQLSAGDVEGLVQGVVDDVESDVTYVLGAGSTLLAIKRSLGFDGSPLGVDVWRDGEVVVLDASEKDLLEAVHPPAVAVVTPIGGQGFILGRGIQQLSPAVLSRCDLEVVATRKKLEALDALRVDLDDPATNEELRGWIKVRIDRHERRMMKVI